MQRPETEAIPANNKNDIAMPESMPAIDYRRKYLPGLDSLRFFAAALVVFGHVDVSLHRMGYKEHLYKFFPFLLGDKSVVFFFVLSGFLITYLLMKEKEVKEISLKNFYAKRVFRIWPVYFIVIFFAIFIIGNPQDFTTTQTILLCLICPNIALVLNPLSLGYAIHTWSIGVEEQFYLMWPVIIKKKNYLKYILYIYVFITILHNYPN